MRSLLLALLLCSASAWGQILPGYQKNPMTTNQFSLGSGLSLAGGVFSASGGSGTGYVFNANQFGLGNVTNIALKSGVLLTNAGMNGIFTGSFIYSNGVAGNGTTNVVFFDDQGVHGVFNGQSEWTLWGKSASANVAADFAGGLIAIYTNGDMTLGAPNALFKTVNSSNINAMDVAGPATFYGPVTNTTWTASRLVAADANKKSVTALQSSGQIPIGNATGGYTMATITQGNKILVANGSGAITLSWDGTNVNIYTAGGSGGGVPLTVGAAAGQYVDLQDWVVNSVTQSAITSNGVFYGQGGNITGALNVGGTVMLTNALSITSGGTAASSAINARTNLGIAITNAIDVNLTTVAEGNALIWNAGIKQFTNGVVTGGAGNTFNPNQFDTSGTIDLLSGFLGTNAALFGITTNNGTLDVAGPFVSHTPATNRSTLRVMGAQTNDSTLQVAGAQTNQSALNVAGAFNTFSTVTNWSTVRNKAGVTNDSNTLTSGAVTNASSEDVAGAFNTFSAVTNWGTVRNKGNVTNDAAVQVAGNQTNQATLDVTGPLVSHGAATNRGTLRVMSGQTNDANLRVVGAAEFQSTETNSSWMNIAGGVTNYSTTMHVGLQTNQGTLDVTGPLVSHTASTNRGTLRQIGGQTNDANIRVVGAAEFQSTVTNSAAINNAKILTNWSGQVDQSLTASRAVVTDANKQLVSATGTPDGTKFLRDDGTYAVPPGTGGNTFNPNQFDITGTIDLLSGLLITNTALFGLSTNNGTLDVAGPLVSHSSTTNRGTVRTMGGQTNDSNFRVVGAMELQSTLTNSGAANFAAAATNWGTMNARRTLAFTTYLLTNALFDGSLAQWQYTNIASDVAVTVTNLSPGIRYTLSVSNPGTFSVTFANLGANDWITHPGTVGGTVTNGVTEYVFWKDPSGLNQTNIIDLLKDTVYLPGANVTFTTNTQSQITIASSGSGGSSTDYVFNANQFGANNVSNISVLSGALLTNIVMAGSNVTSGTIGVTSRLLPSSVFDGTNAAFYTNISGNLTVTVQNIFPGVSYSLLVSNPGVSTVSFTGISDWPYNPANAASVATTNGVTEYMIWRDHNGKTNALSLGQPIVFAPGANVTFTTNTQSQVTIASTGGGNTFNPNQFDSTGTIDLLSGLLLTNALNYGVTNALYVNNGGAVTNFSTTRHIGGVTNDANTHTVGAATNISTLDVAGAFNTFSTVTNWSTVRNKAGVTNDSNVLVTGAAEFRSTETNTSWLNVAGGVTNYSTTMHVGLQTNQGALDVTGPLVSHTASTNRGTVRNMGAVTNDAATLTVGLGAFANGIVSSNSTFTKLLWGDAITTNLLDAPYFVFEGDSLTTGQFAADATSYGVKLLNLFNYQNIRYTNFATSGNQIFNMEIQYPTETQTVRPDATNGDNIIWFLWGGINDFRQTNAADSTFLSFSNLCQKARNDGFRVVALTPLIWGDSSSNNTTWQLYTNFNVRVRANSWMYDQLIDTDLLFPWTTATRVGDLLHLTAAANQTLALCVKSNLSIAMSPRLPQFGGRHFGQLIMQESWTSPSFWSTGAVVRVTQSDGTPTMDIQRAGLQSFTGALFLNPAGGGEVDIGILPNFGIGTGDGTLNVFHGIQSVTGNLLAPNGSALIGGLFSGNAVQVNSITASNSLSVTGVTTLATTPIVLAGAGITTNILQFTNGNPQSGSALICFNGTNWGAKRLLIGNSSIVIDGDSMSQENPPSYGVPYGRYLTNYYWQDSVLYTNYSQEGDTASNIWNSEWLVQGHTKRPSTNYTGSAYYFIWAGVNDMRQSNSAAAIYTWLSNQWQAARADGFIVTAFTIPYFTAANGSNATVEAIRTALNTSIKGDSSLYDYLIDMAAQVTNTTTQLQDGLHLIDSESQNLALMISTNIPARRTFFPQVGGNHQGASTFFGIGTTLPLPEITINHSNVFSPAEIVRAAPLQVTNIWEIQDSSSNKMIYALSNGVFFTTGSTNNGSGNNAGAFNVFGTATNWSTVRNKAGVTNDSNVLTVGAAENRSTTTNTSWVNNGGLVTNYSATTLQSVSTTVPTMRGVTIGGHNTNITEQFVGPAIVGGVESNGVSFLTISNSALKFTANYTVFAMTADGSVTNITTTTNTLWGTGIGSRTLPANFWTVGRTLDSEIEGPLFDGATPGVCRLLAMLNSSSATNIAAQVAFTPPASVTLGDFFRVKTAMTCRTTGASGTIQTVGSIEMYKAGANTTFAVTNTLLTVDTTIALTVDHSFTNGAATDSWQPKSGSMVLK